MVRELFLFPQRRQLRLGDGAVFVGIELIEECGGKFVAAEFAVLVGVALLKGTACTTSARFAGLAAHGHRGCGEAAGFVREGEEGWVGRRFVVLRLHHEEREGALAAVHDELVPSAPPQP